MPRRRRRPIAPNLSAVQNIKKNPPGVRGTPGLYSTIANVGNKGGRGVRPHPGMYAGISNENKGSKEAALAALANTLRPGEAIPNWALRLGRGEMLGPAGRRLRTEWMSQRLGQPNVAPPGPRDVASLADLDTPETMAGGVVGPAAATPPPESASTAAGLPGLPENPQLPGAPMGAYTDPMYEAERAGLEQDIRSRYAQVLKQLGMTQGGVHIPGTLETEAGQQRTDLSRQLGLTREGVVQDLAGRGALWSGRRATEENLATHPILQSMADLELGQTRGLADLQDQGRGILGEYNTRNLAMLAEAAQRAAGRIAENPPYADIGESEFDEGQAVLPPDRIRVPGPKKKKKKKKKGKKGKR